MKYLGIDFGAKRVGVAVSDESGTVAFPRAVLQNGKKLLSEILKMVEQEKIEGVVIGESKNFDGEPNEIMSKIEGFKKELEEKTDLKIYFEPEYLTSAQAERIQGKGEMHDASAAALILQSHLNKINNKNVA